MKGHKDVASPQAYLASLDATRRPQLETLHKLIVRATGLKPYVHSGMLAYGRYSYRYASGREGEWFCVGLASNAAYISLYAVPYELETFSRALPKANLGKGCIRFKRVDDVDLKVIEKIVKRAARSHGKTVTSG